MCVCLCGCMPHVCKHQKRMLDHLLQSQVVVSHPVWVLETELGFTLNHWAVSLPQNDCFSLLSQYPCFEARILDALRRVLSAMMQPDWQCQNIYFFSKPTWSQSVFTSKRWLNCYLINKRSYCHSAFRRLWQATAGQLELYGYTLSHTQE